MTASTNVSQVQSTGCVSVGLHVHDEGALADVLPGLLLCPSIELLSANGSAGADVRLVLADGVTDAVVSDVVALSEQSANRAQRTVLVAAPLPERHLPRLFAAGVVAILPRRDVSERQVIRAVHAAHQGRAVLPETLTRWLVDELRFSQSNLLATQGLSQGGLTVREVEVLRLIAEGHDTAAIAARLSYSERTIKKIVQELMARLELRNRAHAVSYATKVGAI